MSGYLCTARLTLNGVAETPTKTLQGLEVRRLAGAGGRSCTGPCDGEKRDDSSFLAGWRVALMGGV
jgi:hypothetical protein